MPEIARMSHTHLDIARFLLENPAAPLSAVAEHFGYTQSWLSTMIHSSAFQAHLAELQGAADKVVVLDVPTRLRGVAGLALDKLGEALDQATMDTPFGARIDRDFVRDTAETTLKALGYGQRTTLSEPGPAAGNTVIYADAVMINSARERILERGRVIESSPPEPRLLTDEQVPSGS